MSGPESAGEATARARDDLIARLEAIEKSDRLLEIAIFRHIGLTERQEERCRSWCKMDGRTDLTRDHYIDAWAPNYTNSVDAALSLLPADVWYFFGAGKTRPDEPLFGAMILRADSDPETAPELGKGEHPTSLPTAICIAALRARAQESGQ